MLRFLIRFISCFLLLCCAHSSYAKGIIVYKDIPYANNTSSANTLDIYTPENTKNADVLVFIHGGSWNSGDKDTYSFIGKRLAKKGKVCVIINYRLAPEVGCELMAKDCSKAIQWIHKQISNYGGNQHHLTLSGHSAGGHLAAYIIMNNIDSVTNLIQKCVLIDSFGLDMFSYLSVYKTDFDKKFYETFTADSAKWRLYSPIYSVRKTTIDFQIYYGGWTYPAIKRDARLLQIKLNEIGTVSSLVKFPRKRHVMMVIQFYFPWSKIYKTLIPFMEGRLG